MRSIDDALDDEHDEHDRIAAARRRGDVAAAGQEGDEVRVRTFLSDADAKVRVAALTALVRRGDATAGDVALLLGDPDPRARRDACELAPHVPGSPVAALLQDPDHRVVEVAAFAVGELGPLGETGDPAVIAGLARIAQGHTDPLCRESAVAALGAIGAQSGRSAVLGALNDVPAVRRRAVVALAAFSGADVDAALRDRLEDRDWQVRQAAQEVLGLSGEEPR